MSKKFQLKNGLKVLLVESHKSPVVSVQMWVRTGSADERPGEEGVSHFIEHLLFKGTKKFAVGEIASTIEGSGGELNAYTSFDQTVYYITISKQFSDTALDVIAEMIGSPLFDEAEINNEREVVIEEIKRGLDNPHRRSSQLLFSTNYRQHPYGLPVIGFEKIIRKISKKKIIDYFNSRYVPKNMTLLVVGDFSFSSMKEKIKEKFSEIPAGKWRKVKRKREGKQHSPRIKIEQTHFAETLVNISWKIPAIDHPDIPALEVLSLIFGQGDSSRLCHRLRLQEPLVNDISASCFTSFDPGFLVVSFSASRENLSSALEALKGEISRLILSPPTQEELKKAIVNLASEEFYSLETVDGMARKFGHYEFLFGDSHYFNKFMKSIYELTPEKLIQVARKYILSKTMNVTVTVGQEKKELEKVIKNWVKAFPQNLKREKGEKKDNKKSTRLKWQMKGQKNISSSVPEKQDIKGGVFIARVSYDTPVVNLRCAFRGGIRLEPIDKPGLTELFARSWASSTRSLSELEMYQAMDGMAAGLSSFGGRNTVGLNLTSISTFWSQSLDIFGKVLREPLFSEEVIEREKVVMLEHIKNRNDNPAQVAIQNFMEKMFKNHPYGRDPLGNEKSIREIDRNDLLSYYQGIVGKQNFVAVASGYFGEKELKKELSRFLEDLPDGKKRDEVFSFQKASASEELFLENDKEQTHIVLGYPGLTFVNPKRYVLQVLQSILAGQGGRLFIELRDKASLAYSVSPFHMEGIEAGYFGAYIGCSPDKGEKAISMMKKEFNKLENELISEEELEKAKRYLIGRHDIDLQKNSAIAATILFDQIYDIDYRETFFYAEKIRNITSQDVRNLAQELFSQPFVASAVGRQSPF